MLSFLEKIKFKLQRPKLIIAVGSGGIKTREIFFNVLNNLRAGKGVFVYEGGLKETGKLEFLIKNSSLPVLILNNINEEEIVEIKNLAKKLPEQGYLISNFDDNIDGIIKEEGAARKLNFGFKEGADFLISDVNANNDINFKITHKGNTVPFWLKRDSDKEGIYNAAIAASAGLVLGLNLVEISQALKTL